MPAYNQTRIGLVQFLGSNCDQDCVDAFKRHYAIDLIPIWHTEQSLPKLDGLILPGGFSYGDALRSGSLASHTKIMSAVRDFVSKGGSVLGICNGFQILTESHLLPGALLQNASGKFICTYTDLLLGGGSSGYHKALAGKGPFRVPIAHGEGRYFAPEDDLKALEDNGQILFRYENNLNGSLDAIAGIISKNGRVMGMMPHPERATDTLLGGSDLGLPILNAFLDSCL